MALLQALSKIRAGYLLSIMMERPLPPNITVAFLENRPYIPYQIQVAGNPHAVPLGDSVRAYFANLHDSQMGVQDLAAWQHMSSHLLLLAIGLMRVNNIDLESEAV